MSNSKQEAAAREKERELDKEQKLRRDSRRNSVLPKDLDTLDDSDFFSRSSTSVGGEAQKKKPKKSPLPNFLPLKSSPSPCPASPSQFSSLPLISLWSPNEDATGAGN